MEGSPNSRASPRLRGHLLGRGHFDRRFGTHSPGPAVYSLNDGMGSQFASAGRSSPRYSMRSRLSTPVNGKEVRPGPGAYHTGGSFGAQTSSVRTSSASFGFGKVERHRPELQPKKTVYMGKDFERESWGDTAWHCPAGTHANHGILSMPPSVLFDTGPRYAQRVSPGPRSTGINSPGPGIYTTKHTLGPGAMTGRYRVQPSYTFSSESRFAY